VVAKTNSADQQTLYFANVSMGTPPQNLRLHIDTGSSDLWTNAASSKLCKTKGTPCSVSGTYDANSSSTYQYVSSDFNISYVDGSGALGDYATETLHIGGQQLSGLQFGIGYRSSSPESILGIGYVINEVQANRNNKQPYPNVPQLMADKGLINSNAYSLWLNDLDANTGSILFGGVNTDKYHGQLQTLPILKEGSDYAEFVIAMTGMSVSNNGRKSSLTFGGKSTPVLLDSGSSLTYLPDTLAQDLFNQVGAQYDNQQQAAYVSCSLMNNDSTVDFTFSSPTISVPMTELVINPGTNPDGSAVTFDNGTPACIFGISPAGQSTPVLGDTFLRSAYVVYDLANNQISLAQTNFNSTQDSILEIGTGSKSIPDATGVSNPVTTGAGITGGARLGSATLPAGPTQTGASGATATAKTGAAAPVHIPIGVVAAALGAGLLFAI